MHVAITPSASLLSLGGSSRFWTTPAGGVDTGHCSSGKVWMDSIEKIGVGVIDLAN